MTEQQAVLFRDPSRKREWSFELTDQRVIFKYNSCFDRDNDEWDNASGEFSIDDFANGLRQFFETGSAEIRGDHCTLKIESTESKAIQLFVDLENRPAGPNRLSLWLKEIPISALQLCEPSSD